MEQAAEYFQPINKDVNPGVQLDNGVPVLCAAKTTTSFWNPDVPTGIPGLDESLLVVYGNQTSVDAAYDVLDPLSLESRLPGGQKSLALPAVLDLCPQIGAGCHPQCVSFVQDGTIYFSILHSGIRQDPKRGIAFTWRLDAGTPILESTRERFPGDPTGVGFGGFIVDNGIPWEISLNEHIRLSTLTTPATERTVFTVDTSISVSTPVYLTENQAMFLLAEVDRPLPAGNEMVVAPLNQSESAVTLDIAIRPLPLVGIVHSVRLISGIHVLVLPAGHSLVLVSMDTGRQVGRLCCASKPVLAVRATQKYQDDTRIFTASADGLVERWSLSEEFQVPTKYLYNGGSAIDVFPTGDSLLSVGGSGIARFAVDPQPLVAGADSDTINMNIAMCFIMFVFVLVSFKNRQRYVQELDADLQGRLQNGDPSLVSRKSRLRSSCIHCCSRLAVVFGLKVSMEHYEVHRLPDYNPAQVNIILWLCNPFVMLSKYVGLLRANSDETGQNNQKGKDSKIEVPQTGALSWFTFYTSHVILVLYLVFVALTFSPNVFGSFLGPAAGPTGGKVCEFREVKLMEIKQELLDLMNFSAGEIQLSDFKRRPDELLAVVNAANDRLKSDPPFPDFPNFTRCDTFLEGKREELIRQIQSDDCKYETTTLPILKSVGYKYVFPNHRFWPILERIELPPEEENKRQCPIDPGLLTDIDELREILSGYIGPQERSFEEIETTVENAYSELIKTLLFQANFAADMYIFYVCVCLMVRPPLRLGKSRVWVLAKRTFLNWQQIPFILLFTILAYTLPPLLENFNFVKLYEQLQRFMENAGVDMCFVQPSFLAEVSETIFETCEEVDELKKEFDAIVQAAVQVSRDADSYFLCEQPPALVIPVLAELQEMANATLSTPFFAQRCEDQDFEEFLAKFSNPSVNSPSLEGFTALFAVAGVILQLFGKFILVNFGLSVARWLDPLSFHGGRVEIIPSGEFVPDNTAIESGVVAIEQGHVLPPAAAVAAFLSRTYQIGMMWHVALVSAFLLNLTVILHTQVANATPSDQAIFAFCAFGVAILVLLWFYWLHPKKFPQCRGSKGGCFAIAVPPCLLSLTERCRRK